MQPDDSNPSLNFQQRMRVVLERLEEKIWASNEGPSSYVGTLGKRWLQILHRSLIGFFSHNTLDSASALTYATLLSLVPMLALVMAGLTIFGLQDKARDELKHHPVIYNLGRVPPEASASRTTTTLTGGVPPQATPLPGAIAQAPPPISVNDQATTRARSQEELMTGPELVDRIFDAVDRANLQKLGPVGAIGLFWAVMGLFGRVERAMNRAWMVRRNRSWVRKIGDYFNLLIICVLILLALTATTSSYVLHIKDQFNKIPGAGYVGGVVFPFAEFILHYAAYIIIWPAFIVLYFSLPNTAVKWKSAIAGGLVAGTLYQIVQYLFVTFSGLLIRRYGAIYGSVAIMFVIFFWIFVSWTVLLWGAEVCAAYQNLRELRRSRRVWHDTPFEFETLALRLGALLTKSMAGVEHRAAMSDGDLADALNCPPEPLCEMLELFRCNSLVVQSMDDATYTLGRSPDTVSALDVLRLVRQKKLQPSSGANGNDALGLDEHFLDPLREKTLSDLSRLPLDEIETVRF